MRTTAALRHLTGRAVRAAPPRRTVRLRLTALYGGLFLACGAGLLAITNVLARSWPGPPFAVPAAGRSPAAFSAGRAPDGGQSGARPQMLAELAHQHTAELNQLLAVSGIALAVMAVTSAALGWLMAGRVLRPLRQMTTATRAISQDNLHQRLALPGPGDELKDLGDTIDALLGRLETAFGAQRRFAANASHELRTPLAMMRTSLDVATGKPAPIPPEVMVLAGKLREGLDQADRLVESLMLLARAQHGAKDDHQTLCLGHLLTPTISDRAGMITRMRLRVQQDPGEARVTGNATLLARLASNLIDNAIRHNQPGGWIHAQTSTDGTTARLIVENGGPVLDQDTVTSLTQPFRRLDPDRTGSATGTGLGLSIVEAITTAHGGTLRLHARPQGGFRVTVELPRTAGTPPARAAARPAGAGVPR